MLICNLLKSCYIRLYSVSSVLFCQNWLTKWKGYKVLKSEERDFSFENVEQDLLEGPFEKCYVRNVNVTPLEFGHQYATYA